MSTPGSLDVTDAEAADEVVMALELEAYIGPIQFSAMFHGDGNGAWSYAFGVC